MAIAGLARSETPPESGREGVVAGLRGQRAGRDDGTGETLMPQPLVFAISADYERRTGGWTYAQNFCRGLRRRGWPVHEILLPPGFPTPGRASRAAAAAALAALPDKTTVVAEDLCLGVLPEVAAREGRRLRLVMIVHHPLALELGRPATARRRLAALERTSLAHMALVLSSSPATTAVLASDYGVPPERLVTAAPGIHRRPLARGSMDGVPSLLSVGAVVPRKDPVSLVEALAGLADRPWRLTLVGNRTRYPVYAAELEARIATLGLAGRVRLTGELDERALGMLWATADLYVGASTYEGYGLAVAEAVSAGLPVVTTAAGGVAGWLDRRAGIVVPVGDVAGLRAAVGRVLDEPELRRALRAGALAARPALPTWEGCIDTVEAALGRLAGRAAVMPANLDPPIVDPRIRESS